MQGKDNQRQKERDIEMKRANGRSKYIKLFCNEN